MILKCYKNEEQNVLINVSKYEYAKNDVSFFLIFM